MFLPQTMLLLLPPFIATTSIINFSSLYLQEPPFNFRLDRYGR